MACTEYWVECSMALILSVSTGGLLEAETWKLRFCRISFPFDCDALCFLRSSQAKKITSSGFPSCTKELCYLLLSTPSVPSLLDMCFSLKSWEWKGLCLMLGHCLLLSCAILRRRGEGVKVGWSWVCNTYHVPGMACSSFTYTISFKP